jgi:hypothetical protein
MNPGKDSFPVTPLLGKGFCAVRAMYATRGLPQSAAPPIPVPKDRPQVCSIRSFGALAPALVAVTSSVAPPHIQLPLSLRTTVPSLPSVARRA